MGDVEADKTPDHLSTSGLSRKPRPEQGTYVPPDASIPTLLMTVKKPAFLGSLRQELRIYIWRGPTTSQACEMQSVLTIIP